MIVKQQDKKPKLATFEGLAFTISLFLFYLVGYHSAKQDLTKHNKKMELRNVIEMSHEGAKKKGFWNKNRNVGEALMLVTSELGEAIDAHQKGKFFDKSNTNLKILLNNINEQSFNDRFRDNVKDTFEDEIADAVIRLFDLAGGLNIDLEKHILCKLRYNASRPQLHGKNY